MIDIIDSHQHLWDLSRHAHAWCASIPLLNRSFTPDEYAAAAGGISGARVVAAVHVETDVDEPHMAEETRWVLDLADDPTQITNAVVACCRPEASEGGFRRALEPFRAHPRLKGVRRVLHTQPDDLSQSSLFRSNVRSLTQYGLSFDLCVLARQLPIAVELVRACPDVPFVLDHCGVPDVKGKALDPWRSDLKTLADHPNVIGCKISGLPAYAGDGWTPNDLRPFVEHAAECFGHDRILFGSDWPVCLLTGDYAEWAGALLGLTRHWSDSDRNKLFSENARRVYRIEGE
jgi:predicted TIM-barrel fold metal-dependent hydrolase